MQRKVIKSAMADLARTKALRNPNPSGHRGHHAPSLRMSVKGEGRSRKRKRRKHRRLLGHGGKGARIPFREGGGSQLP